jgi:hypothetical protein
VHIAIDCTRSHTIEFHLRLVQGISEERGHFLNQDSWFVRKDGQAENCVTVAGSVGACYQSSPEKLSLQYGFMRKCVQNARCVTVLCVYLSGMENRVTLFYVAAILKIWWPLAAAAQSITMRVFCEKIFGNAYYQTDADKKL